MYLFNMDIYQQMPNCYYFTYNIRSCTDGWDRRDRGCTEWRKGTGWLMCVSLNCNPGLLSMQRDKPAAARILEGEIAED